MFVSQTTAPTTGGDATIEAQAHSPSNSFDGIHVRLPRPITRAIFDRYCEILGLSDAQRVYADICYERYQERLGQVQTTWAGPLRTAWEPLHNSGPSLAGLEVAYLETMRIRDLVDDELKLADERLLAELESILSESQQPQLRRVRMHRARDSSPLLENEIYESTIDLSALVERMNLEEAEFAEVDPGLWEYEQRITPLFVRRDEQFRDLLVRANQAYFRMMVDEQGHPLDNKNPMHREQRRSAFKARSEALSQMADLQQSIARVNREFLPKVLAKLPNSAARSIEETYRVIAWDRVYPDKTDPERLYEELLKSIAANEDLKAAVQQIWSQYRKQYQDVCAEAQLLNEGIETQIASTGLTDGVTERRSVIAELMWKRIELNNRVIESIVSILPAEMAEANRDAIREFELRLERARPPKAPFDADLAAKRKPPDSSKSKP